MQIKSKTSVNITLTGGWQVTNFLRSIIQSMWRWGKIPNWAEIHWTEKFKRYRLIKSIIKTVVKISMNGINIFFANLQSSLSIELFLKVKSKILLFDFCSRFAWDVTWEATGSGRYELNNILWSKNAISFDAYFIRK